MEDYVEIIYHIQNNQKVARAKDIASGLKVNNSSVTGALHSLSDKGMINYTPYGYITLTKKGIEMAKDVVHRHDTLHDFFVKVLAVEEKEAQEAACKMEHSVPPKILERFIEFVQFLEFCPRGGNKWIRGFSYHCQNGSTMENCERCIQLCLEDARKQKADLQERKQISLDTLEPGDKARIVKIGTTGDIRKRLIDMGANSGTMVEVVRVAPMGNPIDIKIKGYHLSLRKEEAQGILVTEG